VTDKKSGPGGELEYAVLATVWELGTATVRDIYERVGAPQGLIYTTVAKVVDRLAAKGLLSRSRARNAFVYRARVKRHTVERAHLKRSLSRLLGWDAAPAMATLVEAVESLDPELLADLSKAVEARRRRRK
jgi:predicted transcriptional regulator